jgi:ADP-heptose:LPS heptosyltransferase
VLVNISAGTSDRRWPADNYVAVIERIREREPNAVIRMIAAPNEQQDADAIASRVGVMVVRTPSIRDAFALVASADFVFTPDTSIAHAASAFRTPCVVMYRKGTAERWRLYDTPGASIEHGERNLATLALDRVLPAIDEQLDRAVERGRVGNASLGEAR